MRIAVNALLVLSALTASTFVLIATSAGIGVSPDSVLYLTGAHSLATGHGYSDNTEGPYVAITKLPPLFPLLVSIGERCGFPAGSVVRAMNVLLFPIMLLLAALVAWKASGSGTVAAATAVILATSPPLIEIFANALSEPLFLVLTLAAVLVLNRAIVQPRWLLPAAAIAGIVVLDRYAGLAFVVVGATSVMLLYKERRFPSALVYIVIGVVPLLIWIVRNLALAQNATERIVSRHLIGRYQLEAGGATLWKFATDGSAWKQLDRIPHNLQYAVAAALATAVLVHAFLRSRSMPEGQRTMTRLMLLFAVGYTAFILISVSFVDASTGLDFRILSPLLVIGVILGSASIHALFPRVPEVFVALVATFVLAGLPVSIAWTGGAARAGIGYGSFAWQHSPLIQRVKQLPPGMEIYSNAPDGVHFLAGRPCRSLPMKFQPLTGVRNQHYLEALQSLMVRPDGQKVIAYFDTQSWRSYYPARNEIASIPGLRIASAESDGALFVQSR